MVLALVLQQLASSFHAFYPILLQNFSPSFQSSYWVATGCLSVSYVLAMRYRASATLLVLSALTSIARADDCTDGPINQPIQTWGKDVSNGGFCHTQWTTGLSVTGVEVWATQWQITGIQLTYSDGTKGPVQGQTNGDYSHDAINWDVTKPITAMKLAGNYAGDGLGLVHIEVDGKTLDVKSDVGSNTGDNVVLATGTMLGASGEAPDFVRAWRPLFMGEANGGAQITDVAFDDSLEDMNAKQQCVPFSRYTFLPH